MALEALTVASREAARLLVVFLHGHDMRPEDFVPFAPALGASVACDFPRGPCTTSSGANAWWIRDRAVLSQRGEGPWDLAVEAPHGHVRARQLLAEHIRGQQALHPETPVLLAGFSQGGMVAMDTLLFEDVKVDALALVASSRIAFDTWRPRLHRLSGLPVLVAHGTNDEVLSFDAGQALRDAAQEGGAEVQWLPFEGTHEVPLAAWGALRRMARRLADHAP